MCKCKGSSVKEGAHFMNFSLKGEIRGRDGFESKYYLLSVEASSTVLGMATDPDDEPDI